MGLIKIQGLSFTLYEPASLLPSLKAASLPSSPLPNLLTGDKGNLQARQTTVIPAS
jgi:hypothetical protein